MLGQVRNHFSASTDSTSEAHNLGFSAMENTFPKFDHGKFDGLLPDSSVDW